MFLRLVPHWSQSCKSFDCTAWSCLKTGLTHLTDPGSVASVFEVTVLWRGRRGVWPRYRQPLSWVIVALLFSVKSQSLAEVVPVGGFIYKRVMSGCSLIHLLHKTVQTWTAGMWRPLSESSTNEKLKHSSPHEVAPLHSDVNLCFFYLLWSISIIHVLTLNMQLMIFLFYNFKHRN